MSPGHSSGRTIFRNSFWILLEIAGGAVSALITSVAVARVIGPEQLGYFNYVFWLANVGGLLASAGMPAATMKFVGEFVGAKRPDLASGVFRRTLHIQSAIAIVVAGVAATIAFIYGMPSQRASSVLLTLSILPQMVMMIPSAANNAMEQYRKNTHAAMIAMAVNTVGTGLSLIFGWNLVGIAATVLIYRTLEMVLKLRPLLRWSGEYPRIPLPEDVRKRLRSLASAGGGLMVLQVVLWDRSDLLLLRWLQPDLKELAYFSVPFSLVERLLVVPRALSGAMAGSQMKTFGMDPERLRRMTSVGAAYISIVALPVLVAASCLAYPITVGLYGPQYKPAVEIFALATLFAFPKALLMPATNYLLAVNDVKFMLKVGAVASAINIGADFLLIPGYGALGATIGNGLGQGFAVFGLWWRAIHHHQVLVRRERASKLVLAIAVMAGAILCSDWLIHSMWLQLFVGLLVGGVVYVATLRVLRLLDGDDSVRLMELGRAVPGPAARIYRALIRFLIPQGSAALPAEQAPLL